MHGRPTKPDDIPAVKRLELSAEVCKQDRDGAIRVPFMRSYIRHPSDIPIEYQMDVSGAGVSRQRLNNISEGGLSFRSGQALPVGSTITIRISEVHPDFEAKGQVIWCRRQSPIYEIGVAFIGATDLFQVRMVEQICHIEQYKAEVLAREGRRLSGEQAAREWIEKFAEQFPQLKGEGNTL